MDRNYIALFTGVVYAVESQLVSSDSVRVV
jgi:hypothetical protein